MTERTAEASPRFKARMAGSFYVLAVLTAVFGEFFIRGRSGIAVALIAVPCYVAVTLLLNGIWVGGSFRITMRSKERVHEHVGTYQVVEPPAKLSFTWSGVDNPEEITLVTVEFLDHGDESELVITHERFTKADVAERYEMGWGTIARKFAAYLANNKKPTQRLA